MPCPPNKHKKRYWVVKREVRDDLTEIAGHRFGTSNAFTIGSASLARDIDKEYGRLGRGKNNHSVVVMEVTDRGEQRAGYKVYFGALPEMPWKRKKRKRS